MNDIIRQLERQAGQVTSQIITDLIEEHAPTRERMIAAYERYKAERLPIKERRFDDANKVNNRLNNDFVGDVVDTKVGYFAGKPISYQVDKTSYETGEGQYDEARYDRDQAILAEFLTRNNMDDLDSETTKMAGICGLAGRLLYIDQAGQERAMLVDPWECIWIYDRSIAEPQYAMRYYKVKFGSRNFWRVEWYTQDTVTFYLQDEGTDGHATNNFVIDSTEAPRPHMFEGIPLIAIRNNDEEQGDADKALPLIDAYDRTFSDVNSEIESFRLAYMAFYGVMPDAETIRQAKQTGAFGLPDPNSRMEFITKSLDDNIVEHHLDRLEQNILRFTKSVNFGGDEAFAGNLSGVAMKFKLFALESKCITFERKFSAALREQFRLLASAWRAKQVDIDYLNIYFGFKRNLPLNLLDEAQTTGTLKGLVSESTRLGLLSFIDDVAWELEEMERDNDGKFLSITEPPEETEETEEPEEPENEVS